jgi:hypothetical protein
MTIWSVKEKSAAVPISEPRLRKRCIGGRISAIDSNQGKDLFAMQIATYYPNFAVSGSICNSGPSTLTPGSHTNGGG